MSEQMPPNPPGSPVPPTPPVPRPAEAIDYGMPPADTRLATTAMVLGIIGLVTGFLVIGVLPGIAGAIIGILALTKINSQPRRYAGKGFAITGIVTGSLSVLMVPLLLLAILVPALGKARELANRSYCSANLRGITQSMVVYSNENDDSYPLVMPPEKAGTYRLANDGAGGNTGSGLYVDQLKALRAYYSASGKGYDSGSIPANLWILVLHDQCSPKQFICKSDPVATNISRLQQSTGVNSYYINFNGANPDYAYSYSTAYPWAQGTDKGSVPGAWWKNTTDSSLPVMSDMAPANGSGSSPVVSTPGTAGEGISANGPKAWNSPNHGRAGQIVAFADCHTEWCSRPDVGQSSDNIFTGWGASKTDYNIGVGISGGTVDGVIAAQASSPFDIVMVPVSDVGSGARR